jgi:hypothetical protein
MSRLSLSRGACLRRVVIEPTSAQSPVAAVPASHRPTARTPAHATKAVIDIANIPMIAAKLRPGALDHGRHGIILCLRPASAGRARSAETNGPAKLGLRIDALWQNVIKIKYFIGRRIAAVRILISATFLDSALLPPSGDRASPRSGYPYLIGLLWACG